MSWEEIIKVSRYEKEVAEEFAPEEMEEFNKTKFPKEVFALFRTQLEKAGRKRITSTEARKLMESYKELENPSEDTRKEYALLWALGLYGGE